MEDTNPSAFCSNGKATAQNSVPPLQTRAMAVLDGAEEEEGGCESCFSLKQKPV